MSMKLTAEQVRKAILIGGVWDEDTGTYYVNRTDMQAIADELNAALDGMDSCRLYLSGKESNYKKLFGTPEKVARMIIDSCGGDCCVCLLPTDCPCHDSFGADVDNYDALLEWLRGDA